jgi:minor extracellular serine protease Vpr
MLIFNLLDQLDVVVTRKLQPETHAPAAASLFHMRHFFLAVMFAAFSLLASPALAQRGSDFYAVVLKDPPLVQSGWDAKNPSARAAAANRAALLSKQSSMSAALAESGAKVFDATHTLVNALYVAATPEQLAAYRNHPDVAFVQRLHPLRRHINRALDLANIRAAWNQVGGVGNAGAGVKIAILDSGIDIDHPAFKDFSTPPPAGFPKCRADNGDCNFTNNKVIAARSYVDMLNFQFGTNPTNTRPDDRTPRDRAGHGTAVAMIAAGQEHDSPSGRISGAAPRAFLGNYKVFGSPFVNDIAYANVVIRALEDALADGMDIANLSLGGPADYGPLDRNCGTNGNQVCDIRADAVQNAVRAGLIVVASAGNDGFSGANAPALTTVGSPGTAPDAITVGAVTNGNIWVNTVSILGTGVSPDLQTLNSRLGDGPQITTPLQAPIVDIASVSSSRLACDPLPDNSLTGRIVLIDSGNCTFARKVLNAQRAGAIAVLIGANPNSGVFQPIGLRSTSIPAAIVTNSAAQSIRNAIANQSREARIDPAFREVNAPADEIAGFSSQGPAIGSFGIKPDLVAVGTDLFFAVQRLDAGGELFSPTGFAVGEGTSFAAPFAAGAAAILKQRNASLTPGQVKSALVNTANPNLVDFDNSGRSVPASISAMGAGKLDAIAALQAGATIEPATIGFGDLTRAGNLPSAGLVVRNILTGVQNFSATVQQRTTDSNARVVVSPANFAVPPNGQTQITVRLEGTRPRPGKYEGFVNLTTTLSGSSRTLRIPYSYYVGDNTPWNTYALIGGFLEAIPGFENCSIFGKVIDQFGVPVADVPVRFTIRSGNGNFTGVAQRTDFFGIAQACYLAGSNLGEQVVRMEAGNTFADFVTSVFPRPALNGNGIRDAATGEAPEAFSPGQYISLFGNALSSALKAFSGPELPISLAAVSVSFDNESQRVSEAGRLQFVSENQINVQIPWETQGLATVDLKVSIGDYSSAVQTIRLRQANPAFFEYTESGSNRRLAAALDGSFGLISSGNPVARGAVAQLYVNGLGPVDRTPGSGQIALADPLSRTTNIPSVTVGGRPAQVLFSGLAPGIVGLYQVNILIPSDAPTGAEVELSLNQSGVTSRTSRISVR